MQHLRESTKVTLYFPQVQHLSRFLKQSLQMMQMNYCHQMYLFDLQNFLQVYLLYLPQALVTIIKTMIMLFIFLLTKMLSLFSYSLQIHLRQLDHFRSLQFLWFNYLSWICFNWIVNYFDSLRSHCLQQDFPIISFMWYLQAGQLQIHSHLLYFHY